MDAIVKQVETLLRENSDADAREDGKRFFKGEEKEAVKLRGVKTAVVRSVAKSTFARIKSLTKNEIFALCDELWRTGYLEDRFVACEWSYAVRDVYFPDDFRVFESWLNRYVDNWATCDTLCNHTVGSLVELYPDLAGELLVWADSGSRWLKRGAAVALIVPARKGLFLDTAFTIADRLFADSDDMVQKGYGWMLKAASQAHPDEVFAYLLAKRSVMPRTAFRYALEKLPKDWREKAMRK